MQSCDASLRRLQTDHIDIYQMHRPDPDTPIDETLQAFDDLVRAGKVRAVGTSTFSPAQLAAARAGAERLGLTVPCSEQPPFSVLVRAVEVEVLPWCRQHDVGTLVLGAAERRVVDREVPGGIRRLRCRVQLASLITSTIATKASATRSAGSSPSWARSPTSSGLTLIQLALGFVLGQSCGDGCLDRAANTRAARRAPRCGRCQSVGRRARGDRPDRCSRA